MAWDGVAWKEVRSESGVWMSCSPAGFEDVRKGDSESERSFTHAKAEAGDEGKRAASPDGKHGDVKGPVFGADLCCHPRSRKK
jgi:hypothetical protein